MGSLALFQASMRGWLMSTTTTCREIGGAAGPRDRQPRLGA